MEAEQEGSHRRHDSIVSQQAQSDLVISLRPSGSSCQLKINLQGSSPLCLYSYPIVALLLTYVQHNVDSTNAIELLRPDPVVIDPTTRIAQLKEYLVDKEWQNQGNQNQKTNILKLIKMYETGELEGLTGGIQTWLKNGEVLDHEPDLNEITTDTALWLEVYSKLQLILLLYLLGV